MLLLLNNVDFKGFLILINKILNKPKSFKSLNVVKNINDSNKNIRFEKNLLALFGLKDALILFQFHKTLGVHHLTLELETN